MDPRQLKTLSKAIASLALIASLAFSLPGAGSVRAAAGDITRVSVSSSEVQGNDYSRDADVSADGRFVVFWSASDNLVAGDTNGWEDLFLRDRQAGTTTRVSVSSSGGQADNGSYYPAISGDGRFIAFASDATNLVSGDTNGVSDIFLRDRQTGTTKRISVSSSGAQGDDISDSYIAISGDGRFIAFASDATNLVSGDTNGVPDLFVHDRVTGVTERISLDSNEAQANNGSGYPSISADGRFVAFSSSATNLVSGDTNAKPDIFVRDRTLGVTMRVSVNSNGVEADRGAQEPAISGNGRYVTFSSVSTNLFYEEPYGYPHVYLHDRQTGVTTLVSFKNGYQMVGWSTNPDISADGRYIAFEFDDRGDGMPFVAIYLVDRLTGSNNPVSSSWGDSEDSAFGPALSGDAHFVAFASSSRRLVPDDTNGASDVFLRELAVTPPTTKTYQSMGAYDGWVIESSENSETGTRIDERGSTFFLGDANNDQQYRSILHFSTASLPNNAIITRVTLKIKKQGFVGDNPFLTHGNVLVDIRKPYFDTAAELQASDFQAPTDLSAVGSMTYTQGALWYTATLNEAAFRYINLTGTTQFRLRFALDDNDDNGQDYMKFFSGNATAEDQPVLTIDYVPNSASLPSVVGILRADPNPTTASNARFTVAFSEAVTGVDVTDFSLATTGGISGASVSSASGSGDTYTVTVTTGTGSGTIRLDLADNDSIVDGNGNPLGGIGVGDGNYTVGELYQIARPNTAVYIAGTLQGNYYVPSHGSARISFAGINNGPVRLINTDNASMLAAERVIYKVNDINTSFSELMGLPNHQLDNIYWLPRYNNVDLNTQLRFGNVSTQQATVHVYIGGQEMTGSPFTLSPGASARKSFAGVDNGPVKIESNVNLVAAERVIYKAPGGVDTSFSEMMALPNSQLDTSYWLPWYNNVDLDTKLRLANVSQQQATVHVYIGGQEMSGSPFTLLAGESIDKSFAGVNAGPVKLESNADDVRIVASERVVYKAAGGVDTSFSEMMALPNSQLDMIYWLPWYNNVDLDTQLRFGNVSSSMATVHVTIGGQEMAGSPFTLAPGASMRKSFLGINSGPVKIESDVNIVAAERVIYKAAGGVNTSFSEMMGLPNSQLDTNYWLPWYNNVDLDTQLRFGIP